MLCQLTSLSHKVSSNHSASNNSPNWKYLSRFKSVSKPSSSCVLGYSSLSSLQVVMSKTAMMPTSLWADGAYADFLKR